jgi:hypothetical protein
MTWVVQVLLLSACASRPDSLDPLDPSNPSDPERRVPLPGDVRLFLDSSDVVDVFSVGGETYYTYEHRWVEYDVASGTSTAFGSPYESSSDFYYSRAPVTGGGRLAVVGESGLSDSFVDATELDVANLEVLRQAFAPGEGYTVLHGVHGDHFYFSDARGLVRVGLGLPVESDTPPPPATAAVVQPNEPPGPDAPAPCEPIGASTYCVRMGATYDESTGRSTDWYLELGRIDFESGATTMLYRHESGDREPSVLGADGAVYWVQGLRNHEYGIFPSGELEVWKYDGAARVVTSIALPLLDGTFPTYLDGADVDGRTIALSIQPGDSLVLLDGDTGARTDLDVAPPRRQLGRNRGPRGALSPSFGGRSGRFPLRRSAFLANNARAERVVSEVEPWRRRAATNNSGYRWRPSKTRRSPKRRGAGISTTPSASSPRARSRTCATA